MKVYSTSPTQTKYNKIKSPLSTAYYVTRYAHHGDLITFLRLKTNDLRLTNAIMTSRRLPMTLSLYCYSQTTQTLRPRAIKITKQA